MREDSSSTAQFSFSRRLRLLKPAEFQRVFDAARRSGDRYFTVLYRENDQTAARLGLTIAKKKVRTAVGRNRIKRVARESFRRQNRTLGGIDIIILAQNAAATASKPELFASLDTHWKNLQRRKDQSRRPRRRKDTSHNG